MRSSAIVPPPMRLRSSASTRAGGQDALGETSVVLEIGRVSALARGLDRSSRLRACVRARVVERASAAVDRRQADGFG
jgi:hypothetical protein